MPADASGARSPIHRPFSARRAALTAVVAVGSVVVASTGALAAPTPPSPATIACSTSTGFLSQGTPTQLFSEAFGSGTIAFNAVGSVASQTYNAISVDPANGYLYGVGSSGNLLRINPTNGAIEDLGAIAPSVGTKINAGGFDTTGAHFYVMQGTTTTLYDVDVTTGAATTITLSVSPGIADFTMVGSLLWGLNSSSAPVSIDPSTGKVTTYASLGLNTGTYGAAFTLGNGDAEFGWNGTGTTANVTEVHIDTSGTTPTFTVVAQSTSPGSSTNDGAACISPATHLSLASTSPTTVAPGGVVTWTVTVTNSGPANSSGFVVSDDMPSGFVPRDLSAGCTATGADVTCTHGSLANGDSATITISATAPTTPTCGSANDANSISVQGNEADSDPGAGNSVSSPTICVTGDTPQTIDFPALTDTPLTTGTVSVNATATSSLPVGFTGATPAVCTVSGGTVSLVSVGICTIDADQPGDGTYQPAPRIVRSFSVTDASGGAGSVQPQAITFAQPADVSISAGTTALTATADSGLTVSFTSTTPAVCTVSGSTVTLAARGTCTINANQPGNAQYAAASTVIRQFEVVGRSQTIDFAQPANADVTGGPIALAATASSGLAVTYGSTTTGVCSVSGSSVSLVAVGICTIVADQPGNATYAAAAPVTRSFAVTDGSGTSGAVSLQLITFPAPANTSVLDGPVTLTATTDAGLPVTYTGLTPAVCTVSGATVTVIAVGTCTIDADQPGDATHAAASTVAASFDVSTAPQQIDFAQPPSTPASDGTVTLTSSSTAGPALAVTYASTTPAVCTVSGASVTLVGPGICTVTADQPGNGTYSPAPTITRSFPVTDGAGQFGPLALPTIAFAGPADTTLATGTVALDGSSSNAGAPVVFGSGTPLVCTVSGAAVTLIQTGTCTIDADQASDSADAAASTVTRSFRVLAMAGGGGGTGGGPVVPPVVTPPVVTPPVVTPPVVTPPVTSTRLAGSNRDATAARVATAMYPTLGSARVVVLARDDVYADALAGSPLASTLGGPLLLTPTAYLSTDARTAIVDVLPTGGVVICLGGTGAISVTVTVQLRALGYDVQRIGGADRYATATGIADRLSSTSSVSHVYLADGRSFADALPAADAAGLDHGVVLLTAGSSMPSPTKSWLAGHSQLARSAVGGAAVAADPSAAPLYGADRYATAAKVAATVAPTATGIVLATGADFPDGLAGAAYAAHEGWSLLLVDPQANALNSDQASYLHTASATVANVAAVGGSAVLPDSVARLVSAHLS